jgi:hypothetical protein
MYVSLSHRISDHQADKQCKPSASRRGTPAHALDHRHLARNGGYPKLCRIRLHPLRRILFRLASRLGLVRGSSAGRIRPYGVRYGRLTL